MFDAKSLLSQLLGAEAGNKLGGVIDQLSQSGGAGALLEQAKGALANAGGAGGVAGNVAGQAGDFLGKAKDFLTQEASALASGGSFNDMLAHGKAFAQENAGALLGGAAAGSLATILLGTQGGRAVTGKALKLGGLAIVGALAYKAYSDWQQGNAGTAAPAGDALEAAPAGTALAPEAEEEQQALAMLALRAMIAAAAADGAVDDTEKARILGRFQQAGLSGEAQAFLEGELASPLDVAGLAAAAGSPEQAVAIYAASLLAIDVDSDEENAYLTALAGALQLDAALCTQLASEVEALRAQDNAA